ncbi:glycosyltransferase [Lysobacter ciconiae]|uniref:Glycosyltransferase n=1 Tax=Novilysobacter ciconiae TaxID=2781022 RepID=A0A7S6ZSH4_9GAMM|nr:glycosyltransferase [Lysobacter ciconiae]QOW19439.1 glycosyltransferase [Lysobacter ciconiae]
MEETVPHPFPAHARDQLNAHSSIEPSGPYRASSVEGSGPGWIERFPIIVHSHLRWDFVWQRPQQILSRMAQHHRIAFIEEPVEVSGDAPASLEISEPMDNIVRIVPLLPGPPDGVDEQSRVILQLVRAALADHPLLQGRFERPVQWFYSPMTAPVMLGEFGSAGVVYDCMDELANFRFAPTDIRQREALLLDRADIVYTGGYQLYEAKSAQHPNVHFHGCGVDAAHFGRARLAQTQVPASIANLARPVFGYFGVIDERLDYPLIAALAAQFPEASIVMAGPLAKVEQHQLPAAPNIHWLGQQAYENLPALAKGFDVCLMPFALNDATRFINPTKTLEYMATATPIVSTAVADVVRNFTPVVAIAHDHEEFLDLAARALRSPDAELIEEGVQRAAAASWSQTVADMRGELQSALRSAEDRSMARCPVVEAEATE